MQQWSCWSSLHMTYNHKYVGLARLTYIGLARTICIRCIYGIFGREITKYTVIYGVYIWFWPTLHIYTPHMTVYLVISLPEYRTYTVYIGFWLTVKIRCSPEVIFMVGPHPYPGPCDRTQTYYWSSSLACSLCRCHTFFTLHFLCAAFLCCLMLMAITLML